MDRAMRWMEVPTRLAMWVAMAAGALMMLQVVADVIGRGLLNRPLEGTAEMVTYWYMVTAAYLPWLYLAKTDGQIQVDFVVRLLPRAVALWLDVAVKLVLAAYCAVFAWQTTLHALRQTARGEVQQAGSFWLPVWPTRWLLPFAAGMMGIWVLLLIAQRLRRRPEPR